MHSLSSNRPDSIIGGLSSQFLQIQAEDKEKSAAAKKAREAAKKNLKKWKKVVKR